MDGGWAVRRVWVIAPVVLLVAVAAGTAAFVFRDDGDRDPQGTALGPLPAGRFTLGVQDDQLPVADPATLDLRMDTLAETGVTFTRIDVVWNEVAPTRPDDGRDPNDPAYVWTRYDAILDGLDTRGISALLDVYRTPAWANGGKTVEWAPTDLDAYGDFMHALAKRYDGATPDRDGRTHARVQLFEPWNEPNIPLFLMPQWEGPADAPTPASPRIYAAMMNRAYDAIHEAQPDAVVIGPCGGPTGKDKPPDGSIGILTFIDQLDPLDPEMDALSQHIYPAQAPTAATQAVPSYATLPTLIAELDRLAPGAPVLITEMGYTTAPTPFRATAVTEEQQAEYLPQMVDILAGEPRVRLGMWFNLQDNPNWPGGLIRFDEGRTRKPSWRVFADTPKSIPSGSG
jgi:hypothetical protein